MPGQTSFFKGPHKDYVLVQMITGTDTPLPLKPAHFAPLKKLLKMSYFYTYLVSCIS